MGSFWHKLKRNKRVKLPTRLLFYDCETTPKPYRNGIEKHVLKVGYACYVSRHQTRLKWTEKWLKFTTVPDFWNFVEKHVETKIRLYLVAHAQNFDFMVVNGFAELIKRGWELKHHIITSNLFIVRFRKKSCTLMVIDSLNWFRASLKSMGEQLGLEKLDIDFDKCSMEELEIYCKRDVAILKDSVLNLVEFIRRYNLGNFQLTTASQAFSAYKHRFMPYDIWIHAHFQAIALERFSYRGGHTEAFFIGKVKTKIYDVDVNSLYPFVMRNHNYPTKFLRYIPHTSLEDLIRLLEKYYVISHVKIKVEEPCIAIKGDRLIFPVGTFDAVLTTPEIRRVLEVGEIIEVKQTAMYEHAPIFKKWVDELYALRLKLRNDGLFVFEAFNKVLLNGLYGKFGQRTEKFVEKGKAPIDEIGVERGIIYETGEIYTEYTFGGKVYRRVKGVGEWRDSFPAIASHVTAFARLYLYDLIKAAGRENCYYVDTDSLFLNQTGFDNIKHLIHESELGLLKVEKVGNVLDIKGCKDYRIDDIEKIKGVKKDARQISDNIYEQTRFYKFRSLLRQHMLDAPLTETITKTLKREYKKGVIQEDGRVTPYVLP